ncbi:hypothetical protein POM88_040489 [Heracleum sosnowskyi]|uniref:Uncharacterized protein n=1 Tax=Heracleum sosnowskyi TaxID=360622 RepID=A0AAD8HE70_9APIA|nr:hypothetical protein POM88_040489 [Heracleum sosnowskyi]
MASSTINLEEMYARLTLEEEEEGGICIGEAKIVQPKQSFILVGRFLTERNINFLAMRNVLAALWRPKEGVEIHDLGGHSDRDCEVVYANTGKVIERAYGVWLRAPNKNVKNHNIGARWLRNGHDGAQTWNSGGQKMEGSTEIGVGEKDARFMETDGVVTEIPGQEGAIRIKSRDQGDQVNKQNVEWIDGINVGGKESCSYG